MKFRKNTIYKGLNHLLKELKENDPIYYNKVDKQNPVRVIRAIEVLRLTGKPYSEQRTAKRVERPFKVHRYVIEHERERLYDRINRRVDIMMDAGLLEEVKSVIQHRNLSSMNTVGYKELFVYLDGESTLEDAVLAIKQNTRRYAKRQLTWFRRHPEATWIPYSDTMTDQIIADFDEHLTANESNANLE